MTKLARALALMVALAALAGGTVTVSAAQDKKPPAKDDKKKDDKKADDKKKDEAKEKVGTVEIVKTKTGGFRYRVRGTNGKVIAMPLPQASWETKEDCLKAIDELKA